MQLALVMENLSYYGTFSSLELSNVHRVKLFGSGACFTTVEGPQEWWNTAGAKEGEREFLVASDCFFVSSLKVDMQEIILTPSVRLKPFQKRLYELPTIFVGISHSKYQREKICT